MKHSYNFLILFLGELPEQLFSLFNLILALAGRLECSGMLRLSLRSCVQEFIAGLQYATSGLAVSGASLLSWVFFF